MRLSEADAVAAVVVAQLEPHCERIKIAGSIRRRRPEVGDIEVVAIARPYDVGLFESGLAKVVNRWPKVKGELGPNCRYTQRLVPLVPPLHELLGPSLGKVGDVKLDLFFASPDNWGLIFAIRTGSADFSHKVLARGWRRMGYTSKGGMLHSPLFDSPAIREEEDLFRLIQMPWVPPEKREV